MPTNQISSILFYHFLKIDSDIDEFTFPNGHRLKKIEAPDWLGLLGVRVTSSPGQQSIETISNGILSNAPNGLFFDLQSLKIYDSTHYLTADTSIADVSILDLDNAIRLFQSGSSGLSNGYSPSSHRYMHPQPGWQKLPTSKINLSDLNDLYTMAQQIKVSRGKKTKILIDRYRNATQRSAEIQNHNRFLDLITILEIIFVPDGASGEIGYKLRMRVAKYLANNRSETPQELLATVKKLYNLRSKIVHNGETESISDSDWLELVEIARISILKYVSSPELFDQERIDLSFF